MLQHVILLTLQVSILMTVFGFGLQTRPADVLYLAKRPLLLGRSLAAIFVIMPIAAVALASAFELRPSVEIALVTLSISPIPPLLPGREERAGGHKSYALGLMAIAGLVSIVTVPATVSILGRYFMQPFALSPSAVARIVVVIAIVPLAAGIAVHATWPSVAVRIAKVVLRVSQVLLGIGVLAIMVRALPAALALTGNGTILVVAAFLTIGLAVGHWLGGPEVDHRTVLALSTACRHPAIALAIAKANFPDEPDLGAAIVLVLLLSVIIGIPYQRRQKRLAGRAGRTSSVA